MPEFPETQPSCSVTFQPLGRRVTVPQGTTILAAGRQAGLTLAANCGGIGVCRKCRVTVDTGTMGTLTPAEIASLTAEDIKRGIRLSCRAEILGDALIVVPPVFGKGQRLQLRGHARALECDPSVHRLDIQLVERLTGESDWSRFLRSLTEKGLPGPFAASPAVMARLGAWTHHEAPDFTVFFDQTRILDIQPPATAALGLAVDLGCTKIAGYLIDLATGGELAAEGVANPQVSWGEDLVSRLVHANRSAEGAQDLAEAVRSAIQALTERLCQTAKVSIDQVADACIVGNTAMTHLLLGLPVGQLLHAPFLSCVDTAITVDADDIDLTLGRGARVFVPPSIGGFVGADHVAVMVAHDLVQATEIVLTIDIGTNSEISLTVPGQNRILATSVPSGPAFEGGHIKDGMRAAPGAIEQVRRRNGHVELSTIDDCAAVGLCGSGVIDLCATMLQGGQINARGHLNASAPGVRRGASAAEYLVCPAERSGHGRDIVFTQDDVGEIQLVKAAIRAGISVLLDTAGIAPEGVDRLILAGAFGSHINLESAVEIGLLPRFVNAAYEQVGNAAGDGARMMLASRRHRSASLETVAQTTHCDLKNHPKFNGLLARATRFPTIHIHEAIR